MHIFIVLLYAAVTSLNAYLRVDVIPQHPEYYKFIPLTTIVGIGCYAWICWKIYSWMQLIPEEKGWYPATILALHLVVLTAFSGPTVYECVKTLGPNEVLVLCLLNLWTLIRLISRLNTFKDYALPSSAIIDTGSPVDIGELIAISNSSGDLLPEEGQRNHERYGSGEV